MDGITVVLAGRAFLEGPRWRGDALYVSDMHAGEVLRVTPSGDVEVLASLEGSPSGLGWLPDGRMVVVSMHDRTLRRLAASVLETAADLSALADHEINDMVVDRASGRAYISQFGFDLHGREAPKPSALLRADPDGSVHAVAEELFVANGLVIANDDRTLIVAESAGKRLTAFTMTEDGALTDRREWADLPAHPDGICLDAEGAVWVACPVAERFVRVAEGGRVLEEVDVAGRRAIACALGGDGGRTLFMCTAGTLGDPEESRRARSARLEAVEVAVPGVERP